MEIIRTQLAIVGGGPAGYAAAFLAADLGWKVLLIEKESRLGGVCLNHGCIPSKALIGATRVLTEARESARRGIHFPSPSIEIEQLRLWKESILAKLASGVTSLAQKRGVTVCRGTATFESNHRLSITSGSDHQMVEFDQAIIATGSTPFIPESLRLDDPRVMTSTEALQLPSIPRSLLVIGGGYIGLEMGTIYSALGTAITMVETTDSLLTGADPDLVRPVALFARKSFKSVKLKTQVSELRPSTEGIVAKMQSEASTEEWEFDRVLVAAGRTPSVSGLGLEKIGVKLTHQGFVQVDAHKRTTIHNVYAIGDASGNPMLAHKATLDARIAIQNLSNLPVPDRKFLIPSVVFTDPEIAWCGLTEAQAKASQIPHVVAKFPWGASGRAQAQERTEGMTKLIIEAETERILGAGIVGHGAGELIAEAVVAMELNATVSDLANCVHPHPTLSETFMECAEIYHGRATHYYSRKLTKNPES